MRSLYERIGGEATVATVVDGLYERLIVDPRVLHQFDPARIGTLKAGQRAFFRSALGGGGDEDRPDLAKAHAHLMITDEQVAAVLGHLDSVLAETGVNDDLRRQVMSVVSRLWLARVF
jgi:hemoglobin